MSTEKYYNLEEFADANKVFEEFLSECVFSKKERGIPNEFKISTITFNTKILEDEDSFVNTKFIFDRLKIDSEIIYVELNKNITKGLIKQKKNKINTKAKDKRKLGKGKPFSNQISIGIVSESFDVEHNNPVCFKIFKNGTITATGCKSFNEIRIIYDIFTNRIKKMNREFYCSDKKITINPIKNMKKFEDLKINVEMINGTFKANYQIDLDKFYSRMNEIYNEDEVYISYANKKLIVYYKVLKKTDKNGKLKYPSIFVYNSGAINIISTSEKDLMATYDFILNIANTEYDRICETELKFNDDILDKLQ